MSEGLLPYALLSAAGVAALTVFLLRRYVTTEPGHVTPPTVYLTVFVSWLLVFSSLTFLLPLDLEPSTHPVMVPVWEAVYWLAFTLTWVWVPLLQGYYLAGEFTPGQKLKASLRMNAKFYAVSGLLLLAFCVYLGASGNFNSTSQVLGFVVCLGNVYGLVLSVLLLGYGLVDVPRRLWSAGDTELRLEQAYFEAATVWSNLDECKEALADADRTVAAVAERMPRRGPLRPLLETVRAAVPDDEQTREDMRSVAHLVDIDANPELARVRAEAGEATRGLLASLHFCVKDAARSLALTRHQWQQVVQRAERLERLVQQREATGWNASSAGAAERAAGHRRRQSTAAAAGGSGAGAGDDESADSPMIEIRGGAGAVGRALAYARVRYLPLAQRVLAVVAALFSVVLVWTEVTMFSSVNMSPFSKLLHAARDGGSVGAAQLVAILPLAYLGACAVYSMFRLELFRYYLMSPGRTDENSLLFNATYLLRLIPPIGFNYLTFMRPRKEHTAFLEVIGRMDVVPFLGTDFYVYFPIFIAVFCLANVLNLYGRALKLVGVTNFDQRSGFADEAVAEGRMRVRKAARRRRAEATRTAAGADLELGSGGRG